MASTISNLLHLSQAAFSAYNLYLASISISNLMEYEEKSKKAAEWSNTAANQLYKTRTTQASGTIAVLSSLLSSVALLLTSTSTVTKFAVGAANIGVLLAAREHVGNFWKGKAKVPLPGVGDYNEAISTTQETRVGMRCKPRTPLGSWFAKLRNGNNKPYFNLWHFALSASFYNFGAMKSFLVFMLGCAAPVAAIGACHEPGPGFPPVHKLLNKTHYENLGAKLTKAAQKVLQEPQNWTTNTTSFAVLVTTPEETIWDFYYIAPILGEYHDSEPTSVTGDTAFRVASCSKSFTVYAVLLEAGINLEDPITKFVPELLERDENLHDWERALLPQWDQVTIRSLASQLSGISREGGLSDLAVDESVNPDPVGHGFPPVDEELLAPCMKNSTDRACTSAEILKMARGKRRVFNTNDRSTYSNVGFTLLGMALEKVTGKSYDKVLHDSILTPLGMTNTRLSKPKDSDGIIPYGPNDWAQELGPDSPSGGVYTTPNDFGKYLRSILNSTLLPQAVTNAWMKPHSWTSSGTASAYGMPWEILRSTKLTPNGRAVDIITKGGALTGYFSTIALIPEFGLGVTVLVAGSTRAQQDVRENIIAALVPAAENLVRDEIRELFAGSWAYYSDPKGKPDLNWTLNLEVDEVGPGLRVTKWVSNGTDFLEVYGRLYDMPGDKTKWEARLIPTGIYSEPAENLRNGQSSAWRLAAIPLRDPADQHKIFSDYCMTDVDAMMYSGLPVEAFYLTASMRESPGRRNGLMEGDFLHIPGMRTNMIKWKNANGEVIRMQSGEIKVGGGSMEQVPLMGRDW